MTTLKQTRLALLAVCLLLTSARGQSLPTLSAVDASMQAFVDEADLAGAVTLVSVEGKIVHLGTVGHSDIAGNVAMSPITICSMASMTKPVTAAGALILVGEGKLALDEPVSKHLPDFRTDPLKDITLRHLLTHTSGMVGGQMNQGTLAETVTKMAKRPVGFAPGANWAYSPAPHVVGRVTEIVAGVPYEDFLAKRIFEPLGMVDTGFLVPEEKHNRLAKLYARSSDGKSLVESNIMRLAGPEVTRCPNPSGGLYSTAVDMHQFLAMLLNGGALDIEGKGTVRILPENLVREMTTIQTGEMNAGFVPGSAWGLGVGIVREPQGVTAMLSPGTFGHGGLWGTQGWVDPARKTIYLLLIQRVGIPNADASRYRKAFQETAAKELGYPLVAVGAIP